MTLSVMAENYIQHIPEEVLSLAADKLKDKSSYIRNSIANMVGYYAKREIE
jgi:hypothetical protein